MRKIPIDHPDMMSTLQNLNYTHTLTAFDYSYRTNEVFWCNIGHQAVYKTSLNDKDSYNRGTIRNLLNITTINGLAVDWIYQHIYYTQCWVNVIILSAIGFIFNIKYLKIFSKMVYDIWSTLLRNDGEIDQFYLTVSVYF